MSPSARIAPSREIARALQTGRPVVALESTVITHGLPRPQNVQLAREMEAAVRAEGATPATVGVIDGKIRIGLTAVELARLAEARGLLKVSYRDFATALVKKASGGTTVAGTMLAAGRAGIRVFATGGIGGIHQGNAFDISTDLRALAETPLIVVCAGAKAILDLPATLEYLETMGVPVVGYQTDRFPEFYSRDGGLDVSVRLESPQEIAEFARVHWSLDLRSAVLVTNPIPTAEAIPRSEMAPIIERASREARENGIHGQALTPYLLERLSQLTGGRSLRANLALLLNNARLAAQIAVALAGSQRGRRI
ncbi:MAG TPA: pseudouridine-5'-phosphate glycosidase [Anaerolineales bacterium]|nr:pseudouridine-5'-phosphate glycosidase [Anaerolineales bacterium]